MGLGLGDKVHVAKLGHGVRTHQSIDCFRPSKLHRHGV